MLSVDVKSASKASLVVVMLLLLALGHESHAFIPDLNGSKRQGSLSYLSTRSGERPIALKTSSNNLQALYASPKREPNQNDQPDKRIVDNFADNSKSSSLPFSMDHNRFTAKACSIMLLASAIQLAVLFFAPINDDSNSKKINLFPSPLVVEVANAKSYSQNAKNLERLNAGDASGGSVYDNNPSSAGARKRRAMTGCKIPSAREEAAISILKLSSSGALSEKDCNTKVLEGDSEFMLQALRNLECPNCPYGVSPIRQ